MDRNSFDSFAEEMLSQIERKENQLLEWGFIGGAIDAEAVIVSVLDSPPTPVLQRWIDELSIDSGHIQDIIDNLLDRKLLFPVQTGRYRTRYAETIRLLFLLKQRFSEKDWQTGRNLVSNIKPLLEYRKYPKRDRQMDEIVHLLSQRRIDERHLESLRKLLRNGDFSLSQFQVDSLTHLLLWTKNRSDEGTIIGAGTGSGKTKAFYLPAFAHISVLLQQDARHWTKVIGIYPRVELLKDQFREAIEEIKELQSYFADAGIRSMMIGCYYGDTPQNAQEVVNSPYRKWKKKDDAYICPSLSCPKCGSDLLWKEEDVKWEIKHGKGERERLHCGDCDFHIPSEQIVLTRNRMIETPPDVLFTSTEMLNRKLTNIEERHIFGVQGVEPPLFVLLDEVHIYEGVSGAHVAYLLRRWRKQMKQNSHRGIHFVGLSATLSNPQSFFSQLTGLKEDHVTYVTPADQDMVSEGTEYNLILRGDPFSVTSLLSTSVQTAMLIGRILDPLHTDVSRGAYGSKLFGFTDKLDVINRWYHIEVDAEQRRTLSKFRDHQLFESEYQLTLPEQVALGQIWNAAFEIDPNSLRTPLSLDITSSQYKGVREDAKLVIATSTLEVGFNDIKVGAVIQHKAPRNLASFLQRKGRAGRARGMRPWMIVVTSAYGRDRYVYDYPELLFSPQLNDLMLPLRNTYIQRIQVAFVFMEYLAHKLFQWGSKIDVRELLTKKGVTRYAREKNYILHLLKQLMDGNDGEWKQYVAESLQLSEAELVRLLWTPPRSFFFEVLPTLYIQFETNYSLAKEEKRNYPLRGFIPSTLFTALEVSELTLKLPNNKMESMALVAGLGEFTPGNVSKRFVHAERITEAHWLNNESGIFDLNGDEIKSDVIDKVQLDDNQSLDVCEPFAFKLSQIPQEVSDRSAGYPEWCVHIDPHELSETDHHAEFDPSSALAPVLKRITWYSSEQNNYVKFTRYFSRVFSEVRFKKADRASESRVLEFIQHQKPAAMGFQRMADAMLFEVQPFDLPRLFSHPEWQRIAYESKPTFYYHLVKQDPVLRSSLNPFEIDWLAQIALSSVAAIAVSRGHDMETAIAEYEGKTETISNRTLQVIFQSTIVTTSDEIDPTEESKLYRNLLGLIQNESVMSVFIHHLRVLCGDLRQHPLFLEWVEQTSTTTLAVAMFHALGDMLPNVNTDDLLIDIQGDHIWLSEPESGGLGIVSKLAGVIEHSPAQFEEYVVKHIRTCPRHQVTSSLTDVLPLLIQDVELQQIAEGIREEKRTEKQQEELHRLQKRLDRLGIPPKREFIISLASKLFRNKSSREMDVFVKMLHDLWHEECKRIGCRIDAGVFAVACLGRDSVRAQADRLLQSFESDETQQQKQRYLLVESLLFSDCYDSCPECLEFYSPFQKFMKPSRIIVEHLFQSSYETIWYGEEDWKQRLTQSLKNGKRVRLITAYDALPGCQIEMLSILHTPIELEFEVFYPYIDAVRNLGQEWHYDLLVREVSHV